VVVVGRRLLGKRPSSFARFENQSNAVPDFSESLTRKPPDLRHDLCAVDGGNLTDVHDRRAPKSTFSFSKLYVAWRRCECRIRSDCRNDGCGDSAAVETIMLKDDARTTTSRLGTPWCREVYPDHVALLDHHSVHLLTYDLTN
jgi:hypothetical protein